jgi:hypothetical protein
MIAATWCDHRAGHQSLWEMQDLRRAERDTNAPAGSRRLTRHVLMLINTRAPD